MSKTTLRDWLTLAIDNRYSLDEIFKLVSDTPALAELPVEDSALSLVQPRAIEYKMSAERGNFAINGRELGGFHWNEGAPHRREGQVARAIMQRAKRRFGAELLDEMGQEKREEKIRRLVVRHIGSSVSDRTIRDVWMEHKRWNLATAQFVQTWTAKAKKN